MARVTYRRFGDKPELNELYENDRALAASVRQQSSGITDHSVQLAIHEQRITHLEANQGEGEASALVALPASPGLSVGDCVCVFNGMVHGADPSAIDRMPAVGIVVALSGSSATVRVGLIARGIFTGLAVGRLHYVGTNGRPTADPPSTPGVELVQQAVGIAISSTDLLVSPSSYLFIHRG